MAKGVKVRIDMGGIREYNHQGAIVAAIESMGERIRDAANAKCSSDDMDNLPFGMSSRDAGFFPAVSVYTASPHGVYAEAKNKALSKSLGAGRG